MGKRRVLAIGLVLVALSVFGTACSSGNSKASAQATAQAKAAQAKRARAQAVQRRRLAARRLALRRQRNALARQRRRALRTPVTTPPVTTPPVTTPPVAPASPAADLAAIQRTFSGMNAAFGRGVVPGIVSSVAANYWVANGVYSAAQCSKFEADRGQGVVSEAFAVLPDTLKAAPGWVDPTVGKAPTGRIYSMSVANTQTLVPTGEKHEQTVVIHAAVDAFGTARLLLRCT